MNRRVLLIGVGLIGGSLALAIKKEHDATIIGYDLNEEECKLAKTLQVIDDYSIHLREEAEQADLIVFATPVEETLRLIEALNSFTLKPNVIITDVGSTKGNILKKAEPLQQKGVTFIGGHPMAGSHKSGVGSAKGHLFENAFYIFTLLPKTPNEKVVELKGWLKGTKANFQMMEADEHDLVTGVISHFPHVMAASLVRQVQDQAEKNDLIHRLAAGGFKDITRIASSSPSMWRDIIQHNQENILYLMDEWMIEMNEVRDLVAKGDRDRIYDYFSGAKQYRDAMPEGSKGAIRSFYDLYVDVLDQAGVISHITTILAEGNISITNIRIIEAREDVYGVLRISFRTDEDREKAKKIIEQHQYETYKA
ncbi:prephenate dehydrogenase [Pseudalkalibacillus berkeleyi]|uniref:Prephenate dehydrogenase n=1 Tax=Pseudalkalibacillus berkeleyi TaxID=1069813 RepID=A0ABS9H6Y2_9BACL|nr:prephenate dehydrogenase [Pseudalkalibacillus berkeleyi]MCF6139638.1 prephenate dehydrogenase [Pseudalkalibacillus berkeleyi]